MKNLRPTISPNAVNESGEFNLPPIHEQDTLEKRCMSTKEWTDEKHSMYLESMEASFVNQLYGSKQIVRRCSPKATFSHSPTTTSAQDLGGGCWKKIKLERKNSQINRSNEWHDLKGNSWIHQLRCSRSHRTVASAVVEESFTSTTTSKESGLGQRKQIPSASPHLPLCHHDMFFNDIEMSDQNFVDEEVECEKDNVERLKPLISDTSIRQC